MLSSPSRRAPSLFSQPRLADPAYTGRGLERCATTASSLPLKVCSSMKELGSGDSLSAQPPASEPETTCGPSPGAVRQGEAMSPPWSVCRSWTNRARRDDLVGVSALLEAEDGRGPRMVRAAGWRRPRHRAPRATGRNGS